MVWWRTRHLLSQVPRYPSVSNIYLEIFLRTSTKTVESGFLRWTDKKKYQLFVSRSQHFYGF